MYELTGQKYNRLFVIKRDSLPETGKQIYWKCLCDCGNISRVDSWSLRNNKIKSCGCLQTENRYIADHTIHGYYNTPTYHTWEGMKQRCLNPEATRYPDYGAKGITVCDRWLDFQNFLADMGERPEDHTLDRINPFGHYEPSNCRWATRKVQANNTRRKHIANGGGLPLC